MKRHPALKPLSDDHHRALVLARELRNAPSSVDPDAAESLAMDVRRTFDAELEPHFQLEEEWLFPSLAARGAVELAEQAALDHARLRQIVSGAWAAETAIQLGSSLERHVRFEERVLFPEAERLLTEDELESVREAMATRTPPGGTRP